MDSPMKGRQDDVVDWSCCHFKDLPGWLQDNEFILDGYRPPLMSIHKCLTSVARIHTETGNIWTHLIPTFIFFVMGIHWFFTTLPNQNLTFEEILVFAIYFTGCFACFALSSAYHTFNCHSEHIGKMFCKLDYVGINLIIIGSFCPWIYYCFHCNSIVRNTYYSLTFILGFVSICVSSFDKFSHMECRPIRAGVFAIFGLSGLFPVVHYAATHGLFHAISYASAGWVALMGLCYAFGGILYTGRFPERWSPGKYNILFQSHQLFHIMVSAGALVYYYGVMKIFNYREIHFHCGQPTV